MTRAGFPRISIDPGAEVCRAIVTGTSVQVAGVLGIMAGGTVIIENVGDFSYLNEGQIQKVAPEYTTSTPRHRTGLAV
jgi:uncharacterized protein (DUF433 family)